MNPYSRTTHTHARAHTHTNTFTLPPFLLSFPPQIPLPCFLSSFALSDSSTIEAHALIFFLSFFLPFFPSFFLSFFLLHKIYFMLKENEHLLFLTPLFLSSSLFPASTISESRGLVLLRCAPRSVITVVWTRFSELRVCVCVCVCV